ncbi:MAG: PorV/PorQ family protein [Candidatus Oleimicrobiaceae bacterium]
MKIARFLVLLIVVTLGWSLAVAGNPDKRGAAGAQELLIPVGSRGIAMGGAYGALVTGNEAIFWNPAGLAGTDAAAEATFSHLRWIFDTQINYFAVSARLGTLGSFGLSAKVLDFGDIMETTEFETEGTGRVITPNFITVGLTYSRQMTDRIFFGLNAKLVSESFLRMRASGIALDFGVQYVSSPGVRLGLTLNNFGPMMKFEGEDLQRTVSLPHTEYGTEPMDLRLEAQKFELPSTFEISLGYPWYLSDVHAVTMVASYRNFNASTDEVQAGIEYGFNRLLYLRGGYSSAVQAPEDYIFGFTLGAGLRYGLGGNTYVLFDYAYRDVKYTDANQWFTMSVQF